MSTNAYFNAHFDPETKRIEIGSCKCTPSHPVFAELRFPDKGIVVLCEANNPLNWKQVASAVDEFSDLDGPTIGGKYTVPRKRSINEFLRLCYGRYIANLPEQAAETAVMIVRTQEGRNGDESQIGSDTADEDNLMNGEIVPAEIESPPGSPAVGVAFATVTRKQPAKAAHTLPIWYFNTTTDRLTLFNMCHISSTALVYSAIIAMDTAALYAAYKSGNGPRIWNTITKSLGHFMPLSLSGAADDLQVALGHQVSNGVVSAPRNMIFTIPASVMSGAAERLRDLAVNDSIPCGSRPQNKSSEETGGDEGSQREKLGKKGQKGKGLGRGNAK